jgi:type II secretory pathway component PulJ
VRRRLAHLHGEDGTTLIEMAFTMLLLGVVMTMFLTFVSSMQNAEGRQQARVARNDDVRLALAQLDREIRSGNVFYDPGSEDDSGGDIEPYMSLRVYTQADAPNRNPGNQCSQWRITGTQLQTRRWASTDPEGTVTPWWTIAENVVNRTVVPAVPAFVRETPNSSYASRVIRVRMVVDRPDDKADPEEIDLSITGRNTQFHYPTSVCETVPGY